MADCRTATSGVRIRQCKESVSVRVPVRPRRSCLIVPASSPKMLAKAAELPADEIVVDLEDGVAVADKETARANLARAARGTLAVRINGVAHAVVARRSRGAAYGRTSSSCRRRSSTRPRRRSSTARDRGADRDGARARGGRAHRGGRRVEALVFGPGDFAASLGVPVLTIGAGASEYALARIAVAARAAGVQPVDGPYAVLDDDEGCSAGAERALALGYDGKWVHPPGQIATVNDVFTPSAEEVERAAAFSPRRTAQRARRRNGRSGDEAARRGRHRARRPLRS